MTDRSVCYSVSWITRDRSDGHCPNMVGMGKVKVKVKTLVIAPLT